MPVNLRTRMSAGSARFRNPPPPVLFPFVIPPARPMPANPPTRHTPEHRLSGHDLEIHLKLMKVDSRHANPDL